jgi:ubiquinone/menaquinone biosynthesis C-methylase UbiE
VPEHRDSDARPGSVPYFDQVADGYDARYAGHDVGGHALRARRDRVLELVAGQSGRLLDVGCGTGPMAGSLVEAGFSYVGVDAAPSMVQEAAALRGRPDGPAFAAAGAEALPFASGSFDAAICIGVLERVPDQDRALEEMARAVGPGGRVLVTFPNRASPYGVWRGRVWYPTVAVLKALTAKLTGQPGGPLLLSPVHHWTRREAAARLEARVGPVDAVVPYYFNLLPSPLDELFPGLAYRLVQRAEALRDTRWRWLGAGFIVRATRR